MEAFLGSWQVKDSGDVSAILKKMGANIPKERLDQMSKSILAYSRDGEYYQVTVGANVQRTAKFKLGEEFDHNTIDGRHIKMLATLEGNTLILDQKGDKALRFVMVAEGSTLTMTLIAGDVSCVRHYTKI